MGIKNENAVVMETLKSKKLACRNLKLESYRV
jgi:hypothetical protein